jgi:hypothetical protein
MLLLLMHLEVLTLVLQFRTPKWQVDPQPYNSATLINLSSSPLSLMHRMISSVSSLPRNEIQLINYDSL